MRASISLSSTRRRLQQALQNGPCRGGQDVILRVISHGDYPSSRKQQHSKQLPIQVSSRSNYSTMSRFSGTSPITKLSHFAIDQLPLSLSGHSRHLSRHCNLTTNASLSNHDKGEQLYQQALEVMNTIETLQQQREQQKSEEMHRAIEQANAKQEQFADNPKAASLKGVAVVKTVVKQTRREKRSAPTQQEKLQGLEQQAHELLTQAGELGHAHALVLLGNQAMNNATAAWRDEDDVVKTRQLVQEALDLYQSANSAEGWFNAGQLLWTGYPAQGDDDGGNQSHEQEIVLPPNTKHAMKAFRQAIDLGDADAMYFVGVQFLSNDEDDETSNRNNKNDNNTDNNHPQEGLKLLQKAANAGHGPARYYLALLHLNGHSALGLEPCTDSEFIKHLDSAVETGNADALFLRGHSRHEGENGYAVDYPLALQDFLAAAEAGHADAAVSAGAMLHQGRRPGVPVDQRRAFELYQTAGEMGSREGWRNVAACYALGEGVPQSEATARYILQTMLKD